MRKSLIKGIKYLNPCFSLFVVFVCYNLIRLNYHLMLIVPNFNKICESKVKILEPGIKIKSKEQRSLKYCADRFA